MKKFLYVFTQEDCDALTEAGYVLLKFDIKQKIYIFENKDELHFSLNQINVVQSNTFTL